MNTKLFNQGKFIRIKCYETQSVRLMVLLRIKTIFLLINVNYSTDHLLKQLY